MLNMIAKASFSTCAKFLSALDKVLKPQAIGFSSPLGMMCNITAPTTQSQF